MADSRAKKGMWQAVRHGAWRVDEATPDSRDRAVDALRACAILGVVLGHWLVTALVAHDGGLYTASPLGRMPWLAPISWIFQTLAVFFLVGGHVATKSLACAHARGLTYGQWLRARLGHLARPVLALLCLWAVVTAGLLLTGAPADTVHTLVKLALSPLWFLLVFAALTAARAGCCCSSVRRPRWASSAARATRRPWSASPARRSPTWTRRPSPPSPSASPSAASRCCCATGCAA